MLSVVGEVPDGAPRTVAGLDELLLEAKLSVPGPRPSLVSRTGLVERTRASGCRVVGVTAPATTRPSGTPNGAPRRTIRARLPHLHRRLAAHLPVPQGLGKNW